jgi:uncharacterized protein (DUF58 family)
MDRKGRIAAWIRHTPGTSEPTRSPVSLPLAERTLRKMELQVIRRLDGVNSGVHRSTFLGGGTDLAEIREYLPGDDVRSIDWNVTARTGHPHVRIYDPEREVSAFFVIDRSASMGFGTAARTKEELLQEVVAAVSAIMLRSGDRIGGMLFGDEHLTALPFSSGRRAALRLLELLEEVKPEEGRKSRLDLALDEANRVVQRASVVVVVSDWISAGGWEEPLKRLAHRHEVLAVEIRDPRENLLPPVGPLVLQDPETGNQLELDTSRPQLREAYQAAAEQELRRREEMLAASGAGHLIVSTDRDWLLDLTSFLMRRRRFGRRGARAMGRNG